MGKAVVDEFTVNTLDQVFPQDCSGFFVHRVGMPNIGSPSSFELLRELFFDVVDFV